MEASKLATGAGESVSAGVGQISPLGEPIRRNATCRHEFVHFEPHHNTFRVEPRRLVGIALRYTALQYTLRVAQ